MKKVFTANIKWKSYSEGGRKAVPEMGTHYCPLIRFEDNSKEWSLDFICPNFQETSEIEFSFLVDSAPYDKIHINTSYMLFEGRKNVAAIYVTGIK